MTVKCRYLEHERGAGSGSERAVSGSNLAYTYAVKSDGLVNARPALHSLLSILTVLS